jgi:hypothetical protein
MVRSTKDVSDEMALVLVATVVTVADTGLSAAVVKELTS